MLLSPYRFGVPWAPLSSPYVEKIWIAGLFDNETGSPTYNTTTLSSGTPQNATFPLVSGSASQTVVNTMPFASCTAARFFVTTNTNAFVSQYGLTSLWFKTSTASHMNLVKHASTTGGYDRRCWVNIKADGAITGTTKNYSSQTTLTSPATGYNDGQWHHVVLIWGLGATSGNKAFLFVDNVQAASGVAGNGIGDATGGIYTFEVGADSLPYTGQIGRIRECGTMSSLIDMGADAANLAQIAALYNEMAPFWRP